MLCIVRKIIIISNWENVKFYNDEESLKYYYDIYFVILELLIEMIQGASKQELMTLLIKYKGFDLPILHNFLKYNLSLLLNDKNHSPVLYNIRYDLINFIMCFLEEKNVPDEILDIIILVISPNDVIRTIVNTMKKIYLYNIYSNNPSTNTNVKKYYKYYFDHKMYDFFYRLFYNEDKDNLLESKQFLFANRLFYYIKLCSVRREEACKILDIINQPKVKIFIAEMKEFLDKKERGLIKEKKIDKVLYENYHVIMFFEDITRKVYINFDNKIVPVYFTKNPMMIKYLSANTMFEFITNVSRKTRFTKLFSLMEKSEYFYDEIIYNEKKTKQYRLFRVLNSLNYRFLEIFNLVLYFGVSLLMLSFYDHGSSDLKLNYIIFAEISMSILNFIIIICWFFTKFFIYKKIDQKRFGLKIGIDYTKLNLVQTIWIVLVYTILLRNEVTIFILNLAIGCIGLIDYKLHWLFFIQLLSVLNHSTTIKRSLLSLTRKSKQLLRVSLIVIVVVYEFSSIAFFFLANYNLFTFEIETPKKSRGFTLENKCQTLLYCFLTHLDYGIRSDGGIGYLMPIISFREDKQEYVNELIYISSFFIFITFILLTCVLVIIIEICNELDDEFNMFKNDMNNVCFICGGSREDFKYADVNFNHHISNDHDIYSYIDYMIGLKFADPQECNATNSYALDKFISKSIKWIPKFSNLNIDSNYKEKYLLKS